MDGMFVREAIRATHYNSPYGVLVLGSFDGRLCLCDWLTGRRTDNIDKRLKRFLGADFEEGSSAITDEAARQLDEFFDRKRRTFDIPLLFVGTDFQKAVWKELAVIPFGETISYGEMARRIGMPKAVRAVASACGANALSVFVPCHRVIGSDRSLTGYAGGLDAKRRLLGLEGV